jgi:hypothetical protein
VVGGSGGEFGGHYEGCGMLHTASLLVDDVEDSSLLRRGLPVAHSIFGTAQTINSANYVYFIALQELQKLKNPKAINIYTEELLNLHRGQGMDLFWRDTLTCPTEDDYLEMVGNKTGGLFRLAVKLMQAESKNLKSVPSFTIHEQSLTKNQRLRPTRQPHGHNLPNPRRLPKPLLPRILAQQRPLRRSHRRQILLPNHPQHTRESRKHATHKHPEAKAGR